MSERETGTVKWFNPTKGYGFITRDSGKDLFVHINEVKSNNYPALEEGQKVEYTVGQGKKGLQAQEVTEAG